MDYIYNMIYINNPEKPEKSREEQLKTLHNLKDKNKAMRERVRREREKKSMESEG